MAARRIRIKKKNKAQQSRAAGNIQRKPKEMADNSVVVNSLNPSIQRQQSQSDPVTDLFIVFQDSFNKLYNKPIAKELDSDLGRRLTLDDNGYNSIIELVKGLDQALVHKLLPFKAMVIIKFKVSIGRYPGDFNWRTVLARKPGSQNFTAFYFPHIANRIPDQNVGSRL